MARAPIEPGIRTPIDVQLRRNELNSILHEVEDQGFVSISMLKLLRLLGRGNRSARTWRELSDEWEALGYSRDELFIFITPWQGHVVLTKGASSSAIAMAGE